MSASYNPFSFLILPFPHAPRLRASGAPLHGGGVTGGGGGGAVRVQRDGAPRPRAAPWMARMVGAKP